MAVVRFDINVPDAEVPRVVAALKTQFNLPNATNAEIIERLRLEFVALLKGIVKKVERETKLVEADVIVPPDAT